MSEGGAGKKAREKCCRLGNEGRFGLRDGQTMPSRMGNSRRGGRGKDFFFREMGKRKAGLNSFCKRKLTIETKGKNGG